ncbi:MAG: S-methyl-5-thioribose-1-phosphate isomerase [Legionellales bacterium]|nr:S-methyl-5-thioribose-1-phosphate isomerase [Legionellales bacterium]
MLINEDEYTSIWVENSKVMVIDQRWLPHKFQIEQLKSLNEFYIAIRDMWIRGAPLIGVTAAYGIACHMEEHNSNKHLLEGYQHLLSARPTAVNLKFALDFMFEKLKKVPRSERFDQGYLLANKLRENELEISAKIGEFGSKLIKKINDRTKRSVRILTHCNAGWLATVDYGTATAPIYWAQKQEIPVHVFVDETRPRNQGAQLTCWELGNNKVPYDLIADNAGGHLMQNNEVDIVIVGTDRTTSTGDVCNKVGTYLKALAAADNDIPFYVALPSTTIDWTISNGSDEIEIEEREQDEVHFVQGINSNGEIEKVRISPPSSTARNPAFDVTPSGLVTGLITEFGIIDANEKSMKELFSTFIENIN